ncbi:hypothetical protein KIPB_012279, partial [Kipferlia bialata]
DILSPEYHTSMEGEVGWIQTSQEVMRERRLR